MPSPARRLGLEALEDRRVPAMWPIVVPPGQVHQLLGTYGQYQDVPVGDGSERAIHLHEGLDIQAPERTPVRAVMAGTVEAIYREPDLFWRVGHPVTGFRFSLRESMSFIVIRDREGGNGWNYKHVVAAAGLRVGQLVEEGDTIGTVSTFPGTVPHVHLDRGTSLLVPSQPAGFVGALFSPPALPAGVFRDLTLKGDAVREANEGLRSATFALGLIALEPAAEQPRLYLAAAQTLTAYANRLEAIRYAYPPLVNPLRTFIQAPEGEQPTVRDARKPVVESIEFLLSDDDRPALVRNNNNVLVETPRDTARYFTGQVTIGGQAVTHLGVFASAQASNLDTFTRPGDRANGNIDFVVKAHDIFGTAAGAGGAALNPARFEFSITSVFAPFGPTTGIIPSLNYEAFPGYDGVGDFFKAENARAANENDRNHNSGLTGPFYYILTNTPGRDTTEGEGTPGGPAQKGVYLRDRFRFWDSNAAGPIAEVPTLNDFDAENNATSAFPDGLYNITVRAYDLSDNASDPKTVKVLLTNWQRTIRSPESITTADQLVVTGGDQYLANQLVKVYTLPAANWGWVGGIPKLASGTALGAGAYVGDVLSNAAGVLQNTAFAAPGVAGSYYVVADYNNDGEYTEGLDAVTVVNVTPAVAPAPRPARVVPVVPGAAPAQGQTVRLAATIESDLAGDPDAPVGAVGFFADGIFLGSAVAAGGVAEFDVADLRAGSHVFTALYFGDGVYAGPAGVVSATVSANTTTTALAVSAATAQFGAAVTLTATVSADPTPLSVAPAGRVDFFADGNYLTSAGLGADGTASVGLADLPRGTSGLTAVYVGDTRFAGSTSGSVAVAVLNNAPDVMDDGAETWPGEAVAVDGVRNDFDPDGDALSVTAFTQGGGGSVSLTDWGFLYTPSSGFTGTDTFTYTVSDGQGGSSVAPVTVVVRPTPAIRGVVWRDSNANGVQDTGDLALAGVGVELLEAGTSTVIATAVTAATGVYAFATVPDGTYDVRVTGGGAGTLRNAPPDDTLDSDFDPTTLTASGVVVSGTPIDHLDAGLLAPNQQPWVVNDERVTLRGAPVTIDVLFNDADPDGHALTITSFTQPASGTVALAATGLVYTPPAGWAGTESFTYSVDDGFGGTGTATVTVTVTVNEPAVIVAPSTATVAADTDYVFGPGAITLADVDADQVVLFLTPTNGRLRLADGTLTDSYTLGGALADVNAALNDPADPFYEPVTFVPDAGYTGPATLTLDLYDADELGVPYGPAVTAAVDVTVVPPTVITGTVWDDADEDGKQVNESGRGGVQVFLKGYDGVTFAATTTQADGSYEFTAALPVGDYYYVLMELPSGMALSPPDADPDDTIDSDFYWYWLSGPAAFFNVSAGGSFDLDAGIFVD